MNEVRRDANRGFSVTIGVIAAIGVCWALWWAGNSILGARAVLDRAKAHRVEEKR